jgi:peptidoglycan/xylan/chitin deacetylase (PgdA/CDA1 family)
MRNVWIGLWFVLGAALGVALAAGMYARSASAPLALGMSAATSTAAAPRVPTAATSTAIRVPILVYHIVRPAYPSDSAEVQKFRVTPEVFDAELAWLAAHDYHVVSLSALAARIASGTPIAPRSVVLNFDDAWEDQYVYAFPILEKYHDTATFFVPSNFPGNKSFLSWSQLREMVAAGMTIGSHSASHPFLTKITSTTTLDAEIAGSKAVLERELGVPVFAFDYPFGLYDDAIVALVRHAGYTLARTDDARASYTAADRFTLPAKNAPTTLAAFARYLEAVR